MSEPVESVKVERKVKKAKAGKDEKKVKKVKKSSSESSKKAKKDATSLKTNGAKETFSLLADHAVVDKNLSLLFASKPAAVQPRNTTVAENGDDEDIGVDGTVESDVPNELGEGADFGDDIPSGLRLDTSTLKTIDVSEVSRKRKRKDAEDDLEARYLRKLAREDEKESRKKGVPTGLSSTSIAAQPLADDSANVDQLDVSTGVEDEEADEHKHEDDNEDEEQEAASPPPKHETQTIAGDEVAKASRTVFLGNVSTSAISSKAAKKELMSHLASFFPSLPDAKTNDSKHRVESLRFRSTPFSSAIPKKAAFAKKEVMDATTKSTNAYAVYSSPLLSREAARRLNGTIVLDRHLRVDEVAHPAKVDNHRCVFVGNLGFVDDESNIQAANEEEGRETRKRSKIPADAEEGLWRTFGKCGKVESVRVIRDSTTRVGKGIAYVQFQEENAVEAALLLNEKKFPPMLPRKLRVTRAKAQKKNAKPGSDRPSSRPNIHAYQRKVTGAELTQIGRAGKLLGRAAAAKATRSNTAVPNSAIPVNIKRPENFVFEGHRATSKSGKSGLRLGKKGKGKPANRSAKRGAAFKASKKRS